MYGLSYVPHARVAVGAGLTASKLPSQRALSPIAFPARPLCAPCCCLTATRATVATQRSSGAACRFVAAAACLCCVAGRTGRDRHARSVPARAQPMFATASSEGSASTVPFLMRLVDTSMYLCPASAMLSCCADTAAVLDGQQQQQRHRDRQWQNAQVHAVINIVREGKPGPAWAIGRVRQ